MRRNLCVHQGYVFRLRSLWLAGVVLTVGSTSLGLTPAKATPCGARLRQRIQFLQLLPRCPSSVPADLVRVGRAGGRSPSIGARTASSPKCPRSEASTSSWR